MTEEHEYSVVLDVLQKHYDVLKDINERNRILLGGGVMDQIRFDQMDEIKEAMRWWIGGKKERGCFEMKAKEYNLIVQCVETGVMLGWNRAHKHSDEPEPQHIRDQIEQAVLNEICEWFHFEDVNNEEV